MAFIFCCCCCRCRWLCVLAKRLSCSKFVSVIRPAAVWIYVERQTFYCLSVRIYFNWINICLFSSNSHNLSYTFSFFLFHSICIMSLMFSGFSVLSMNVAHQGNTHTHDVAFFFTFSTISSFTLSILLMNFINNVNNSSITGTRVICLKQKKNMRKKEPRTQMAHCKWMNGMEWVNEWRKKAKIEISANDMYISSKCVCLKLLQLPHERVSAR